jgi:Rrf2 family cysteine metabolism transcriptional repressor
MRISAKGRYALAAMISIAGDYSSAEGHTSIISISDKLGISKIYLEQVFSLLKRGGVVNSVKGAQGGYYLTRMPQQITAMDILSAVELSLFENIGETTKKKAPEIEAAMRILVFDKIDDSIKTVLQKITLAQLVSEAEKNKTNQGYMFFI